MKRRFAALLALLLLLPAPAARAEEERPQGPHTLYVTAPGQEVFLDEEDFQLLCRQATGHELESVTFSPLSGPAGALWCREGREELRVNASVSFFIDGEPSLSQVSFRPNPRFTGTARTAFTLTSRKEETVTGTLLLHVPAAADLTLSAEELSPVKPEKLDALCRAVTGAALAQVTFGYPPNGKLVYLREEGDPLPATDRMVFFMDPEEGRTLDRVAFRTENAGLVPYTYLSLTGRSAAGERFSATLRVELEGDRAGSLTRFALSGQALELDDLAERYAPFTLSLPDSGEATLWLDYGETTARKLLPGEVITAETAGLSCVPADSSPRTIQLDLWSQLEGKTAKFEVLALTWAKNQEAPAVHISTRVTPVSFGWELFKACRGRGLGSLETVSFPTLPSEEEGTLLWSNAPVEEGRVYPYYSLTFSPAPTFHGPVRLAYTGEDDAGISFRGTLDLTYGYPSNARYPDMEGWEWALPAAGYLGQFGALGPEGDDPLFRPGDKATRLELLYALARTAYSGVSGPDQSQYPSFPDLPADPQKANAVALLALRGLVLGDETGHLNPDAPVTRQDALVLLHRALTEKGRDLPASGELLGFADGGDLAPYAREAAVVLSAAGILQGSDTGRLEPQSPITRAEMAALLYRAFGR